MRIAILVCSMAWLIAPASGATMVIESLHGPIRHEELRSFEAFMKAYPHPKSNLGNAMVYGSGSKAAEALGVMYRATGDRALLNLMLGFTDQMLACRNDPRTGRVIWTGKRALCWPNKPAGAANAGYSGTENGDVMAHIALAAKLILEHPAMAHQVVPDGDPHHFGKTYGERAGTYVTACDRTIDTFLLPHFVNRQTHAYHWPTSAKFGAIGPHYEKMRGRGIPWNQQMMLNGAFRRLADCHRLLGDAPRRVATYRQIVRTSVQAFAASLVHYQVDGHDCVKWSYAVSDKTLHHMEDTAHAGYDLHVLGAYEDGGFGLKRETMMALAHTIRYVIFKGGSQISRRVDGSGGVWPFRFGYYLAYARLDPALYPMLSEAARRRAAKDPLMAGYLLATKQALAAKPAQP